MIVPIIPEDIFELNDNLQPQFDKEVITIDNVFKNFSQILDICYNTPVERWKASADSRNFKDYYDCRFTLVNWFPNQEKIHNRLSTLLNLTNKYFDIDAPMSAQNSFSFNYFKHLNRNVSKNLQQYPHYDEYFNAIFYIDPYENGGTALYENLDLENKEDENILIDISHLKIKKIIKSVQNRCVIFPGHCLHGGYIEDHNKYYYNWRINMVNFFNITPQTDNKEN